MHVKWQENKGAEELPARPIGLGYQAGDRIDGTHYRVVKSIGRGGMGAVYEVEHGELKKRFVLKVLHHRLVRREDLVARMSNEWRTLGRLNHPNIVQVTDAGRTRTGLPFFVMERLEGKTLSALLRQRGRLPVQEAGAIVLDVLAGLAAAHERGAIHRDIKPQNIFVTERDGTKLLDFGIAKLQQQATRVVTANGVAVGTPRFMAPEQAQGHPVDGRADIYAAALCLYQAIVGRGPFAHLRGPNALLLAQIGTEPERVDRVMPEVGETLGDLLHRWLAKSPRDRPKTAAMAWVDLAMALESFENDVLWTGTDVTAVQAYDATTLRTWDFPRSGRPFYGVDSATLPAVPARAGAEPASGPESAAVTPGWGTAPAVCTSEVDSLPSPRGVAPLPCPLPSPPPPPSAPSPPPPPSAPSPAAPSSSSRRIRRKENAARPTSPESLAPPAPHSSKDWGSRVVVGLRRHLLPTIAAGAAVVSFVGTLAVASVAELVERQLKAVPELSPPEVVEAGATGELPQMVPVSEARPKAERAEEQPAAPSPGPPGVPPMDQPPGSAVAPESSVAGPAEVSHGKPPSPNAGPAEDAGSREGSEPAEGAVQDVAAKERQPEGRAERKEAPALQDSAPPAPLRRLPAEPPASQEFSKEETDPEEPAPPEDGMPKSGLW